MLTKLKVLLKFLFFFINILSLSRYLFQDLIVYFSCLLSLQCEAKTSFKKGNFTFIRKMSNVKFSIINSSIAISGSFPIFRAQPRKGSKSLYLIGEKTYHSLSYNLGFSDNCFVLFGFNSCRILRGTFKICGQLYSWQVATVVNKGRRRVEE